MISRVGVGIVGYGTVGSGVAKILLENATLIRRRVGVSIELIRIADLDVIRDRGIVLPPGVLVADAKQVLSDPKVDIVVELIGGYDFSKQLILEAISAGKTVVTANKALLALHGEEIFAAASRKGVDIGFEASVGGGIPVIHAVKEGLAANAIQSIYGIINGTSNYILSRMTNEGKGFEETLIEAQKAGYAEADPTFDVTGTDSAHKLAILANLAFGSPIEFKELYTEGITHISEHDIAFAREFGYAIKLLGIAKLVDGEIEARVHPTMLSADSPLAKIEGVYNAIQLVGDAVSDVMLVGRGAGDLAAGSAVVSDIIAGARNLAKGGAGRVPPASFQPDERRPLRMRPMEDLRSMYYLRFMVTDRPGVLSQISGELGRCGISIASMLQKGRREGQTVPVVMKTHTARERDVQTALREINQFPFMSEPATLIRIEGKDE